MKIDAVNLQNIIKMPDDMSKKTENKENTNAFGEILKGALDKVNEKQINADQMTKDAIVGKVDNVHDVLIAAEEARLALELTVQIRNKLVEAYQDINRIQL